MKIAIVTNYSKKEAVQFSQKVIQKLLSLGVTPVILSDDCMECNNPKAIYTDKLSVIAKESDIIITIGGDGTIIHAAKHAAEENKPLLGINFGRVGFVATMEPEEINKLDNLLTGNYISEKRMLLKVIIHKDGKIKETLAINDAVVSRGSLSRMVDLFVYVNDKKICDYRADGVLLSTPTGSTAYSLSAGGPVIQPNLNCILLTPVCPHSLFSRSVIFGDSDKISVEVSGEDNEEVYLTVDGQHSVKLSSGDKIEVSKYEKPCTLISMDEKNFYTVLNNKLNERGV